MKDVSEFYNKTNDELKAIVSTLKRELFNLRFQVVSGQISNTARFRKLRRNIARVKTLLVSSTPKMQHKITSSKKQ